jgi:hypothetical protein
MVCDHLPYLFEFAREEYYYFPWILMHSFGRITAPIFFYLLALGYRRTRNANRYTVRLLVFALISYVPYIWYFEGAPPNAQNLLNLNVIFTMLVGLLLLRAIHEVRDIALKAICIVLCLLLGYWCDYGLFGIAMILICDIAKDRRLGTVLGMGAVIMVSVYSKTNGFFTDDIPAVQYPLVLFGNLFFQAYLFLLLCQLVPLIFIARHRTWFAGSAVEPTPGFWAKWGFYIFYPAHITVLLLIRLYLM